MKKNWKTWIAGGAALTLVVGVLTLPSLAATGSIAAILNYSNMKVTLDGRTLELRDSYGNPAEPFTIDGTSYLPVASISQALGLDVAWDRDTNTIVLTSQNAGQNTGTNSSYIGETKAREIALNHADLTASQATFLRSILEYDDGRAVYDVEFWSGSTEYDYEIDAVSGTILSYDYDAERYAPSAPSASNSSSGSYIGEAKAKEIVEEYAGTTGVYREFRLERDDGRMVYEGELRSGRIEYDFTIDAVTGTILEWDADR